MKNAKNAFSRFGFGQLAGMAAIMLVSLAMTPLAKPGALEQLIQNVSPSVILALIYVPNLGFLLAYWLVVRNLPKAQWQKQPMSVGSLLKIYVMMYAVATILNLLGGSVSGMAPEGGSQQLEMIDQIVNTKLISGILIPTLAAPVLEELIFRKLMIDRLHNYGEGTVILFSALCFGLFHGNLTQFVYATGVGLFLGYVYCKTGKVIYTIVMHMLLNSMGSLVMLLGPAMQGGAESAALTAIVFTVVVIGLVVTGLVLLVVSLKKKFFVLDNAMPEAIAKSDVLKTVYLNPGVLLLFAVYLSQIVMSLFDIQLPF